MSSLTCVHTLYNNTNINTKAHCQTLQSYMCAYPLQQQKHKHNGLLPKCPVYHVDIPYITTQTYTEILVFKTPSIIFVHTQYKNTNINTNTCCQHIHPYIVPYSIQEHKHIHKGLLPKYSSLHVYIKCTTKQT